MARTSPGLFLVLLCVAGGALADDSVSQPAVFPIGVYDKWNGWAPPFAPIGDWQDNAAYFAELFDKLERNGLNTVKFPLLGPTAESWAVPYMDLAQTRGIRVILQIAEIEVQRPDDPDFVAAYAHPAVLAYMIGDEVAPVEYSEYLRRYGIIREFFPDKPIVSAFVGEALDERRRPAEWGWRILDAEVELVRHYPIRKFYDLVDWASEHMHMPFHEFAETMDGGIAERPWWFILQTFGLGVEPVIESYWRYPSPEEMDAMAHIALSQGARALLAYSLQSEHEEYVGTDTIAMLDNGTLQPNDSLWERYGRIADLVHANAGLLLRHERAGFTAAAGDPEVYTAARRDPATGWDYVYVVNRNTKTDRTTEIRIGIPVGAVRDVYSGEIRSVAPDGGVVAVELQPGEGQFWRLFPRRGGGNDDPREVVVPERRQ